MRRTETINLIVLLVIGFLGQSVVKAQQQRTGKTVERADRQIVIQPAMAKPVVTEHVVPTFTAQGGFENSLEKARQSAILSAKEKFQEFLIHQDESINREPTNELIRRMLIPQQEEVQTEEIKSPTSNGKETMYRVTVAVKATHEHLRIMRTRDRSSEALGLIGVLAVILFATAGFFRLDAMTKGFITTWLFLGSVGIGALLIGLWGYAWPW